VEAEFLSPSEVVQRYPLLEGRGVVGGIWTPNDGQTNPIDTTMAYAKGARQRGVKVVEQAEVTDVLVSDGRATGVRVRHDGAEGEIHANTVVLAAGMWSAELGRKLRDAAPRGNPYGPAARCGVLHRARRAFLPHPLHRRPAGRRSQPVERP
jgi:glycine/D-amino acid oxidase-like deaminating enzyme